MTESLRDSVISELRRAIPMEGEAALCEERRAQSQDGSAGDVGALVEEVVDA